MSGDWLAQWISDGLGLVPLCPIHGIVMVEGDSCPRCRNIPREIRLKAQRTYVRRNRESSGDREAACFVDEDRKVFGLLDGDHGLGFQIGRNAAIQETRMRAEIDDPEFKRLTKRLYDRNRRLSRNEQP